MDKLQIQFLEEVSRNTITLSALAEKFGLDYYRAKLIASDLEKSGKIKKVINGQYVVFEKV